MDSLTKDLRNGIRLLLRSPGFACVAIISLAIGIGANSAMFSIVYSVLLRPLPYPSPDELVTVWTENQRLGIARQTSSYANVSDWLRESRTLHRAAIYDPLSVVIQGTEARRVSGVVTTAGMCDAIGLQPQLGRMFTDDEVERKAYVTVISDRMWRQEFGGRQDALGKFIEADGKRLEIVGVMSPGFLFPDDNTVLWLPISLMRDFEVSRGQRGTGPFRVIARLRDGATIEAAEAELEIVASRLRSEFANANVDLGVTVISLSSVAVGTETRVGLWILFGAVAFVLLIACSNVGNMLLARGLARQREFAVRVAIGATRRHLVSQLLLESLVLAVIAAAIGVAIAFGAVDAVRAFGGQSIPRIDEVSLDAATVAVAVVLSIACACVFSVLPVLRATQRDPLEMLRDGGRGSSDGPRGRRLRSALVAGEFALAVVLLAGSAMLLRSFAHLLAVNPGFNPEGVVVVGMRFPSDRKVDDVVPYVDAVLQRVAALPGVSAAAVGEEVLLTERAEQAVVAEGANAPTTSRMPLSADAVTPDYFEAMGAVLREGRRFTNGDNATAPMVGIVNEAAARKLWPDGRAVGRRLKMGGPNSTNPWVTVVGVVADQRRQGLEREALPQLFWPMAQQPSRALNVIARTQVDPASLVSAVGDAIKSVDATVPVAFGTTLRQQVERTLAPRRFQTGLLAAFAGIALLLAGTGIFGLMHYSVARRTHEIGIRTALGATSAQILRHVLAEGLLLAGIGVVTGVVFSIFLLRGLSALLFEVSPMDPASLAAACGGLIAVAAIACLLPAYRASRIDPLIALRAE